MKRKNTDKYILALFIGINLLFIFLQIYKQSYFIKLHFSNQRLEKQKKELHNENNNLIQKYYDLKKPSNIQKYVIEQLDMQKTKLNQIKKLDVNE